MEVFGRRPLPFAPFPFTNLSLDSDSTAAFSMYPLQHCAPQQHLSGTPSWIEADHGNMMRTSSVHEGWPCSSMKITSLQSYSSLMFGRSVMNTLDINQDQKHVVIRQHVQAREVVPEAHVFLVWKGRGKVCMMRYGLPHVCFGNVAPTNKTALIPNATFTSCNPKPL